MMMEMKALYEIYVLALWLMNLDIPFIPEAIRLWSDCPAQKHLFAAKVGPQTREIRIFILNTQIQ